MKKLAVLLSLLLSSCGGPFTDSSIPATSLSEFGHVKTDPVLEPFFLAFLSDCDKFEAGRATCLQNLPELRSVRLAGNERFDKPSIVGHCVVNSSGFRYIEIRSAVVARGEVFLKTLMYHELGHCLLDSGHTAEHEPQIMNPYILRDDYVQAQWTRLVKDLFTFFHLWEEE
jgi:hypothetical protein